MSKINLLEKNISNIEYQLNKISLNEIPINKNIKHLGVIPYSFNNDRKLVFLLGREHYEKCYNASLKFSNFGGSPELDDKSTHDGAARECYEESMGFLGTQQNIYDSIINSNEVFENDQAILYPMEIKYDENMPKLYSDVYNYINKSFDITNINNIPEGYFEKIEIRWFTMRDIINNKDIMRPIWFKFFLSIMADSELVINNISFSDFDFLMYYGRLKNNY